ncbi:MAG: T9SS type A sorting domain-containing protein [bacterium]|nr:MAG: T9SS type A sorting domain-containing protein [bacterium]
MKDQFKWTNIVFIVIFITIFDYQIINAQAIQLCWSSNPENDIKYYGIYKDTTANPEIEIAKVPATDTSYTDNDITIDQKYYYRITAVDSAGNISEISDDILIIAQHLTPVELVSFSATFINNNIKLIWLTTSKDNNSGFEIQKSIDGMSFKKIGFIPGSGTSANPHAYNFLDSDIGCGKYYYRLKQINADGSFQYSNIISVEVNIPEKFELSQNYPNPFSTKDGSAFAGNTGTTIKYMIAEDGKISVVIFDILGRVVRKLVDEYKRPGYYEVRWDGKDNDGNNAGAGIYFCRMTGKRFSQMKKIILTR